MRIIIASIIAATAAAACGGAEPLAVEAPTAKAKRGGFETPCFPERTVLVAEQMYGDLRKYAAMYGEDAPMGGWYGNCPVANSQIKDRGGNVIAELHCGIEIRAGGIVDHLGLEIGALGRQVIAGHADAAKRLVCAPSGEGRARCWFSSLENEGEEPRAHYIVDGTPSASVLGGEAAIAFLADKKIVEFTMRMWCH